jgi:hypothetical protein
MTARLAQIRLVKASYQPTKHVDASVGIDVVVLI